MLRSIIDCETQEAIDASNQLGQPSTNVETSGSHLAATARRYARLFVPSMAFVVGLVLYLNDPVMDMSRPRGQ